MQLALPDPRALDFHGVQLERLAQQIASRRDIHRLACVPCVGYAVIECGVGIAAAVGRRIVRRLRDVQGIRRQGNRGGDRLQFNQVDAICRRCVLRVFLETDDIAGIQRGREQVTRIIKAFKRTARARIVGRIHRGTDVREILPGEFGSELEAVNPRAVHIQAQRRAGAGAVDGIGNREPQHHAPGGFLHDPLDTFAGSV